MQYKRRSIRLKNYDYAQDGAYYVTICTYKKQRLFGTIIEDGVWLSHLGSVVINEWENTALLRDYVQLDEFVVMPNHLHGILFIQHDQNVGAWRAMPLQRKFSQPQSKSLPTIIGAFKSAVTKQINRYRNSPAEKVWQRNYYERIIRDEDELNKTRNYIQTNPSRWQEDEHYIDSKGHIQK